MRKDLNTSFGFVIVASIEFSRKSVELIMSDNPTAQLVQVFQFVSRVADRTEAEAVVEYVWRMRAEMQSIFCNTVASSQRVALFATINDFGRMLAEHKIFFTTK